MTAAAADRGAPASPASVARMRVRVLGSGSRGNASLLEVRSTDGDAVCGRWLIDAGLSPRAVARRLDAAGDGIGLEDLDGILLTHPDMDHLHRGWAAATERLDLPVHLHRRHRNRAVHHGFGGRVLDLFDGPFRLGGRRTATGGAAEPPVLEVEPVVFAHDQLGSVGFVLDAGGLRFGWATDLGHVPPGLAERFRGLHAVAIESNYDPAMQAASDRPAFLKARITGGSGHLSNAQSLGAVRAMAETSPLRHVVLLHLSQQCNDPRLVGRLWRTNIPELAGRICVTDQDDPSPWVEIDASDRGRRPDPSFECAAASSRPAGGRSRMTGTDQGSLF